MAIQVKATKRGYYGTTQYAPGDTFTIKSEKELGKWMQRVGGKAAVEVRAEVEAEVTADDAVAIHAIGRTDTHAKPKVRPRRSEPAIALSQIEE